MRTVNESLVGEYADQIRPLLSVARRAYGNQAADSIERKYSERVNELLLQYVDEHGGNVTHLAHALEGSISLPGLRRRLRAARGGMRLGQVATTHKGRGTKDPELVAEAAKLISNARGVSSVAYGQAIRDTYAKGISIAEVGKTLGVSYYSLWIAASHN